ncbi:hypothetical protein N7492_008137 [Penicillium capsulatum]|uniref:Uncharacterized protein n=1 Tax=Penicillium capsulatum TaxID=69766 RepID=A0A9W9HS01_9EURO|nr:hypothetical protein N7492_008137 [Penicillium capsulatum]KAJ6105548.1 hypothetical protein N7512_009065 [Penicillium capsulatum]
MKLFATSLLLGALSTWVRAEPWFGTQYVALVETTAVDGYTLEGYTRDPIVRTKTIDISPTGTNPEVLSTYTDDSYAQVTAVNLVVAPTAGVSLTTSRKYSNYYVDVVYTAPSSCSYTTSQTLSTALRVYVPVQADNFVTPTAVVTSTKTYQYITDRITSTMAMLDPSDLPTSVYSSLYSYYQPARYTSCRRYTSGSSSGSGTYRSGGSSYSSCDEFIWYIGGSAFSGGYCCSDGCHYTWGISPVALGLAIFFGWFGLFLIIGLIESWFIFRRTMLGHKARTGLPYGFALLCPIVSCLTLITVKKYGAKTPDQQAFLAARWKEMSAGSKFALWVKSFFRRRDPAAVALGLTGHVPLPIPTQNPPPGSWYPPPGPPGSLGAPGAPPMAAYPPQGYVPQASYPAPTGVPREGEAEGQPKTVAVNESERPRD